MSRISYDDLPSKLQRALASSQQHTIAFYKGNVPGLSSGAGDGYAVEIKLFANPPAQSWPREKRTKKVAAVYVDVHDPRSKRPVTMTMDELVAMLPRWQLPVGGLKCTGRLMPSFVQEVLHCPKPAKDSVVGLDALLRHAVNKSSANKQHVDRLAEWFCYSVPQNFGQKLNVIFGWPVHYFFQKSTTAGRTVPRLWKEVPSGSVAVLCGSASATEGDLQAVFGKGARAAKQPAPGTWHVSGTTFLPEAGVPQYIWPKGYYFHSDLATEADAAEELFVVGTPKAGCFLFWENGVGHTTLSYIERGPSVLRCVHVGSCESTTEPGVLVQSILASMAYKEVRDQTMHIRETPQWSQRGRMAQKFNLTKGVPGDTFFSVKVYGTWQTEVSSASAAFLSTRGASMLLSGKSKDAFISGGILHAADRVLSTVLPPTFSSRLRGVSVLPCLTRTEAGRKHVAKAKRYEGVERRERQAKLAQMNVASFDSTGTIPPCLKGTLYPTGDKSVTYVDRTNVVLTLSFLYQHTGATPDELGVDVQLLAKQYKAIKKVASGEELSREIANIVKRTGKKSGSGYRCSTIAKKSCLCPYAGDTGTCAETADIEDMYTFNTVSQRCLIPSKSKPTGGKPTRRPSTAFVYPPAPR